MATIDPGAIREALRLARAAGAGELTLRAGGESFAATFGPPSDLGSQTPVAASAPAASSPAASGPRTLEVRVGHVGYFHLSDPPLEAGETVEPTTIVGLVEALGLANDVVAGVSGEFVGYSVAEASAVEYGQAVAEVRP